jgi:hypothetical protein
MTNEKAEGRVLSWADFAPVAPDLESFGRGRFERRVAYLASVRANGSPRVHPVSPFIGSGCLFVYMEPTSPKVADLRRDARYALHCGVEDNSGGGGEFNVTGRAHEVLDERMRSDAFAAARATGYGPEERHVVFEFRLGRVLATTYQDGPKRQRWSADL